MINENKGNTAVTFSFPYSITETKQVETGFRDLAMWCEITSFVFKKKLHYKTPCTKQKSYKEIKFTSADMTFPKADKDRFIFVASLSLSPVA